MAVKIEKDRFAITIEDPYPEELWLLTCHDVIDALVGISDDFRMNNNYYFLLNIIKDMLPNEAKLKKLIEE